MNQLICQPLRRLKHLVFAASFCAAMFWVPKVIMAAEAPLAFTGEKVQWHGFDRYDFVMDESTSAITPFKSPADEGDGVKAPQKGQRRCIVVVPEQGS